MCSITDSGKRVIYSTEAMKRIAELEREIARLHKNFTISSTDEENRLREENERLKAELASEKNVNQHLQEAHDRLFTVSAKALDKQDRLRAALRRLEWSRDPTGDWDVMTCPSCHQMNPRHAPPDKQGFFGHKPDCWLAALLEGK